MRNVGPGKAYASRADYDSDLAKHKNEKAQYELDYKEWRAQEDRLRVRDRSGRKKKSGAQNRREAAEAKEKEEGVRRQVASGRMYRQHMKGIHDEFIHNTVWPTTPRASRGVRRSAWDDAGLHV